MAQSTQQRPRVWSYPARILILSLTAIIFLFSSNNAFTQPHYPTSHEEGEIDVVKERLKEMNKKLQKLIDDYQNDVIVEWELEKGIKEVHDLKLEAMDEFPLIWGWSLNDWYLMFGYIDDGLRNAIDKAMRGYSKADVVAELERAKKSKEWVEKELKSFHSKIDADHPDYKNIEETLKKLKEMNELLKKLMDDYKNGKINKEELLKGLLKLQELKSDIISLFPSVWGQTFSTWYSGFLMIDEDLNTANGIGTKADVIKSLKKAKKLKEKLETYLNNQGKSRKGVRIGSAWSPPKGETRIAAVGTVRDEKVMMTSRGGSIGGTVTLETEEGEELTSVVPDDDGHFTIDFGDIATTVAVASTLVLTQLDSEGNAQTSTSVEYLPGTPAEVVGIPVITKPDVPFIENNQLNELEGSNFGEAAEVVIVEEGGEPILQETVSASNSLNEYFTDAPVGQAEVLVRNDFGNSEPVEMGIYEFGVTAGKMDLVRNEKTSITAAYEGLPEGTKIIFTNMSENVTVKANGRAKASGNETIFTVKKSTGEVSMTLKARQAGGWVLNYRLEFPVSE